MARHYSVPQFFRQVPNALLKRYFVGKDLFAALAFETMPETKPEGLLEAWGALPDETRRTIEPEFREIFELACEKGFRAIVDEAEWQLRDDEVARLVLVEKLAALKGHHERAMTAFLDHHDCWRGATRFFRADTLSYWRKRRGLPTNPAAIDLDSRAVLAAEIGKWFRDAEGRGRNCVVELFRRDTRDYFFAYPEDFANESIEWVGDQFDRRPHTPAFEVVYVWSASDGTLDVNHRGARKALEPLQAIFARNILKLDKLPPDAKNERIYNLNPLKRREFQFVRPADSGIDTVSVRRLRLSSVLRKGDRIALEADTKTNKLALYDVIEQAGTAFALEHWNVTHAEFAVDLTATQDKAARRETFTVGWPNSCSLKYDELGLKLRAMLVASGIEPR